MVNYPTISVLIPTYNYARYLDEAIQSVINQTYNDYELIIVDNCSTDNTDQVIGKYLENSKISYHKNEKNLGLVGNWNRCLELAQGKYIKFLCADDKFHPQMLEKFLSVMEEYSNVSLVTCYRQAFGQSSELRKLPDGMHKGIDMIYYMMNNYQWIGEPTSVMFRKKDLSEGNFRKDFSFLIDLDMYVRLLEVGDCYVIPQGLSFIRQHANQVSQTETKNYSFTFEDYKICKGLTTKNGYSIDIPTGALSAALKKKAKYCSKVMYKMLPHIHKKKQRTLFFKSLKIAALEGVIFSPVYDFISRKLGKKSL